MPDKTLRGRTYLTLDYAGDEQVKRLGARWDAQARRWFVPNGCDLRLFTRWLPACRKLCERLETGPHYQDPTKDIEGPVRISPMRYECWRCGRGTAVFYGVGRRRWDTRT